MQLCAVKSSQGILRSGNVGSNFVFNKCHCSAPALSGFCQEHNEIGLGPTLQAQAGRAGSVQKVIYFSKRQTHICTEAGIKTKLLQIQKTQIQEGEKQDGHKR